MEFKTLHPICKFEGVSTMATSYATVTTTAPRFPLDLPSSLPTPTHHRLKIASNETNALKKQGPAFYLQSPLNKFMPGKSKREYLTGEPIFSQGDPANAVFYVQSGKVKLTVVSMGGKEAVIAHLPVASFFGEAALAGQTARIASATALESSSILRIDRGVMQDLL